MSVIVLPKLFSRIKPVLKSMKRHPEIGESLCRPLQSLRRVRPIIRSHHERLDGSGYPQRLRGDQVPLLAQSHRVATYALRDGAETMERLIADLAHVIDAVAPPSRDSS